MTDVKYEIEESFTCNECTKTFTKLFNLKIHIKADHSLNKLKIIVKKNSIDKNGAKVIHFIEKISKADIRTIDDKEQEAKIFQNNNKIKTRNISYSCNVCLKALISKDNLNFHVHS